jgi:hypothetical protein
MVSLGWSGAGVGWKCGFCLRTPKQELDNYTHHGYSCAKKIADEPMHATWFEFVEAPAFARFREDYLDDDGFSELRRYLATNPEAGDIMPGAGGIRKLRWKDPRRGKVRRGGLRVIYYCFLSEQEIWLLTLYDKDEAADLTEDERNQLRRMLEAERAVRKGRK